MSFKRDLLLPFLFLTILLISPALSIHQAVQKCKQDCDEFYIHDKITRKNCEQNCERLGDDKTYIFGPESFEHRVILEHGRVDVLKPFPELSPLLAGIANYRLGYTETDPLTFVLPTHLDADSVIYIVEGEGSISILHEGKLECNSLTKGDIMKVWAGSIIYLINRSKTQKLKVLNLYNPLGNPGQYEAYYSAGSEQAQSYYQGFSLELIEAALNTPRNELKVFFERQKKDIIIKSSEEKIQAIGRGSSPSSNSKKPFNLLKKEPKFQSKRGQLIDADQSDYDQLRELNVRISIANISRGSMMAPFMNTRVFKIAAVVSGNGYVEIISRYPPTRVSSPLSVGSVFVSPPGHPTAIVAGMEQDLHIVSFEVQAENNELVYLAGMNNLLKQMEDGAKELAFGAPARVVDEVLGAQKEEVFVAGPGEGGAKGSRFGSLLEGVTGF